jgi:hypothetical protein
LVDIPVSQSKQSAEFLSPFRQTLLTDAHQGCPVMGHYCHAQLDHGALNAFVTYLSRTTGEQTGDVTFDDWTAVAAGTGQLHLVGSTLAVQARLVETVEHLFGAELRVDRLNRLGDADRENPSAMERLTQRGVIDAKIPGHRIDREPRWCPNTVDSLLHLVDEGQHITGIARIALRYPAGKDKARRGLREDTGLPTKLGRAIALAFHDGGNGGIVRIDDFTVTQSFALRQPLRLFTDVLLRRQRRAQGAGQALARRRVQMGRRLEGLLRLLRQHPNGHPKLQKLRFGLAHQLHEDFALPPALAAKAVHDLLEVLLEGVGMGLQRCGARGALLRNVRDEVEDFFCALYSVVASVTRWLPCSEGNVSMSRWAGLTKPSTIAAAA